MGPRPCDWITGKPNPEAEQWVLMHKANASRRTIRGLLAFAVLAVYVLMLFLISGCNLTAHVAARPVIDGTPVSVGVEWRDER